MRAFKFLRIFCVLTLLSAFAFAGEKICEDPVDDGDGSAVVNCFYPAQTIVEAYADFRKSGIEENSNDPGYTNLRAKLEIGKDVKDTYDYVAINYEWNGDKTFVVKMFYVGGETDVKFTQDRNGTRATMIFSPD